MATKISEKDEVHDSFRRHTESDARVNLNDLLRRAKQVEKNNKKNNLILFSVVIFVVLISLLALNF